MPRIPLDSFASHTRYLTIARWPAHVEKRERAFITARLRRELHPVAALTACAEGRCSDPFEVTLLYPKTTRDEIVMLRVYFSHQTSDRAPQIWWAGSAGVYLSDWRSPRALLLEFTCTTATKKNAVVLTVHAEGRGTPSAPARVSYPLPRRSRLHSLHAPLPPIHEYVDEFFRLDVPSEFGGL